MIKHCFLITSAINTRFGVYSPAERLLQTVITIRSIKQKVPDAKIVVLEMAGEPLTEQQTRTLTSEADILLDFTDEELVKSLYSGTENWDIVKNGTEIIIFGMALKLLQADNDFDGIDRIHKISGRYVINDMFDPTTYEQSAVVDKIVVAFKRAPWLIEDKTKSWIPPGLTGQYMSRLWSWPVGLLAEIIDFYDAARVDFTDTINNSRYIDIEHLLCKLLPKQHIHELQNIGIEGLIGPNGTAVKD